MAGFGSFTKGEKKKKKKDTKSTFQTVSSAPVFVLPKKIEKKRKEQ